MSQVAQVTAGTRIRRWIWQPELRPRGLGNYAAIATRGMTLIQRAKITLQMGQSEQANCRVSEKVNQSDDGDGGMPGEQNNHLHDDE